MSEVDHAIDKFKSALARLDEGIQSIREDDTKEDLLKKDGVIQRFEFSFELLWKTLKIYLEDSKGVLCKAPTECLKEAFRLGLIMDEDAYARMLKDRNRTSHLYSKDQAEEIFHNIKTLHLPKMQLLLATLTKKS